MRFREAVEQTEGLAEAYRRGLGALQKIDRGRIQCRNTRNLAGSVNLDEALADSHPNDPRWDYGIGIRNNRGSDRVTWVEVHPASSSHVQDVLDKFAWLRRWLASSAPLLNGILAEYVWVASGSVHIPPDSPQRRRLALQGIRFAGKRLRVP
jgi:hypothetical protein